ncbi:zonadhesin [Trichonephila inaurata madagascariensis]|uniref:Zonadhesin n=1 Tax=Trichonephila inaurata madagascariensis TaxID=2747483 RepID=A0A8X6Y582_9ARAC|nr:zonadhesin [Trichonephila inaurata madagascariensis]
MKQPRRRPYGGMRNHAGSLHNQMYPKRRRQNFKRVRIPESKSNLKQHQNHLKQSGDIPPTIDKHLDKSEPEQHFSEIEQDNTFLQDNTYPSDFEVTTPAKDYDIPQYDNLDDYASHDVQPIPKLCENMKHRKADLLNQEME